MFLKFIKRVPKTIGFRLAFMHSVIFVLSFFFLFTLAYFYLSSSLQRYERENIQLEMNELAAQYQRGGIVALQKEIEFEKHVTGNNPFFVRLAGSENNTVFLNIPDQWKNLDLKGLEDRYLHAKGRWLHFRVKDNVLEILSRRLPDSYLLQVGKSTEKRGDLLKRFHITFAGIFIPVILLSFIGGVFLAHRTLRPIRSLVNSLQSVISTGKMDVRIPTRQTGDELDELVGLFNAMLAKIEILINGMKSSLDNVAHDLRTPLTRLRGKAEMALRSEQSVDTLREPLIDCVEESERVLTMLNAMMDISEAETGAMRLDLQEVYILNLLDDVAELYSYVAEEKGISIHTACPKELLLKIDPNRMRQVLANLLDNAIKYTPSRGRVDIEVNQEKRRVVITIKDTGIGIPPEDLPRVWDHLYRGDKSRSEHGLGLGLSLVKAIVEAHKGHVDVSSEPGAGSVFSIYLPKNH